MHISLGVSMGELYISSQIWGRNRAEICKQKAEHFCGSYISCMSFIAFSRRKKLFSRCGMRCMVLVLAPELFFSTLPKKDMQDMKDMKKSAIATRYENPRYASRYEKICK